MSIIQSKMTIFNQKQQIISKTTSYIENDDQNDKNTFVFDHFRSNSTNFDLNWTTFDLNGPDSNPIFATSKSDCWNRIKNID